MSDGRSRGRLNRDLLIEADQWRQLSELESIVASALETAQSHVMEKEGIAFLEDCEISLVLTDDAAIKLLNETHRGKAKATNVLSFPLDEEAEIFGPMLGDLVFAFETIEQEADDFGLAFSDHLTHLCIHGFLHLLGYDHIDPDEAEKMESVEIAILEQLGLNNPYEGTVPVAMSD